MAVPLRITTVGMSAADAAALRAAVGASPRRDVASVVAAELSGAVDAVVADASLPEEDLRKLLAGGEAPPVVLLAGIDEGWIVARMLRAGAFDWIDRSRVTEDAARVVRRAFDRCESERRRRSANVMLEQVANEQARLVQEGTNRWLKARDALDREVASHRRAQSQLAVERTLLRTVVDNLPDLVYAKDRESRFVLANRAVAELMGAESPDDVAGRSDLDYYPGPVAERFRMDERRVLEQGEALTDSEERIIDHDGRVRWYLTTKLALRDAAGQVTGLVGVGRDITQRRQAEEALREANASLEERVSRRTAELEQARRSADAANRAKDRFLANLSHEIRTPMNAILGLSELLIEAPLPRESQHHARTIYRSAEVLLGLIDDILDLSKIEAGALALHSGPCDLLEVVEDAVGLVAVRAEEKGVELTVRMTAGSPRKVVGDTVRLRQIVLNLVGNAVKFTDHGQVTIAVEMAPAKADSTKESQAKGDFTVVVTDTGIGMNADQVARLFQPFTQADGETTRRFGGTGLGLAISQRLAGLMGGVITVTSEPGRGSTFTLHAALPLAGGEPAIQDLRGSTVLVGDPRPERAAAIADYIAATGAAVFTAGDIGRLRFLAPRAAALVVNLSLPDAQAIPGDPALKHLARIALAPLRLPTPVSAASGWPVVMGSPPRRDRLLAAVAASLGRGAPPPPETSQSRRNKVVTPSAGGTRWWVLLAEDHPLHRQVAKELLEAMGFKVDVAANGHEVVELAAHCAYDLILMDCQMPGMDGFAATKAVRASNGPCKTAPILALTAQAMPGDRDRAQIAGMDDFLTKPMTRDTLMAALARHLRPVSGVQLGPAPRVLVVDDNPGNREVAMAMFVRFDCSVASAASGIDALEHLGKAPADLVLLDYQMPGMDGAEVCRRIRKQVRGRMLVVGCTAGIDGGVRAKLLAAGMDEVVAKPLTLDAVRALVRRLRAPSVGRASGIVKAIDHQQGSTIASGGYPAVGSSAATASRPATALPGRPPTPADRSRPVRGDASGSVMDQPTEAIEPIGLESGPRQPPPPIFDPTVLAMHRSLPGGDALVTRLIAHCRADVEDQRRRIDAAIAAADRKTAAAAAHRMAGSLRSVGLVAAAAACLDLERAARASTATWEPAPLNSRIAAALASGLPVLDGIPP